MDSFDLFSLMQTEESKPLESDSDDEPVKNKSIPIPQRKPLSKIQEQKKLCEDPSTYEYDSRNDDMKAKKVSKTAGPKDNIPSQHLSTLLKAAEKRKNELKKRLQRKVQVEREKEGDKFKDKEASVTSDYEKKMEEEEERERPDNKRDVTKQKD